MATLPVWGTAIIHTRSNGDKSVTIHEFELHPEEEYRCGGCHSVWLQYNGQALRVAGDILEHLDPNDAGWFSCCEGTRRFRWIGEVRR